MLSVRVALPALLLLLVLAVPARAAKPSPDLRVKGVTTPVAADGKLALKLTVVNAGKATAKASTSRFFLSRDKKRSGDDQMLSGSVPAKRLKKRKKAAGNAVLGLPAQVPAGAYYVLACADDLKKVKERNEKNNCAASAATFTIAGAVATPVAPPAPSTNPPPVLTPTPTPVATPTPAPTPDPQDVTAPDTTVTAGPSGAVSDTGATFTFTASEPGAAFECRLDEGAWTACTSPTAFLQLAEGGHSFAVRARDGAGNVDGTPATRAWTVDTTAPDTQITAGPSGTVEVDTATFEFGSPETGVTFQCRLDDAAWQGCTSPHALADLPGGDRTFAVRAHDAAGNADATPASRTWTLDLPAPAPGPELSPAPQPEASQPPLDGTGSTADLTAFLYSGAGAVQKDVAPGTIVERRAAVVSGRVLNDMGTGIGGVKVTVLDHPELGYTATREDGGFDMGANGGESLTLSFEREGWIPVQRQVDVPWQDYVQAEPVVMIPYDAQVTPVDLDAPEVQVARGTETSDADGQRQATLMFEPGTQAEMTLPSGEKKPLNDLRVRATEYTVGANGEDKMPGALPPTSGYTYAVDFTVDAAVSAQATEVTFSKPVINYTDNFLHFPTGTVVPTGSYDRERGAWVPEKSGRVIEILSEEGGVAQVDTDGDGTADTGLGMDAAERARLAELYAPGATLWRVEVPHFSPWDHNWPYGPPQDAKPPKVDPPKSKRVKCDCFGKGSVIGYESGVLGESLGLIGTPFSLRYSSERMPGRTSENEVRIPVTGSEPVPPSVDRIEAKVTIAGKVHTKEFEPAENLFWDFEWDGKDSFGRATPGGATATIEVANVYKAEYRAPGDDFEERAFGGFGDTVLESDRERAEVRMPSRNEVQLGTPSKPGPIGGWSLDVHHAYDPQARNLTLGTGQSLNGNSINGGIVRTVGGRPHTAAGEGFTGDGGPATDAELVADAIATGPDGSVYVGGKRRIRRIDPAGTITTVAGTGATESHGTVEGKKALEAALWGVDDIEIAPDGTLYYTDGTAVWRIDDEGVIRLVAGSFDLEPHSYGEGLPALEADFASIDDIEVAPDGTVYIGEKGIECCIDASKDRNRIRRVGTDGTIWTIAGTGVKGYTGDGGPARSAQIDRPFDMALAPDGSLYFADLGNDAIRRVDPAGIITTVAGGGTKGASWTEGEEEGAKGTELYLSFPTEVEVSDRGDVIFNSEFTSKVFAMDAQGIVRRMAGSKRCSDCFGEGTSEVPFPWPDEGKPASAVRLFDAGQMAVTPEGDLIFADDDNYLRRVMAAFPGLGSSEIAIPSQDGSEVYVFSAGGRHLRTQDAMTAGVRFAFEYDAQGRLAGVADRDGELTAIERDGDGRVVAVTAPGGQRTTLSYGGDGWLGGAANAAAGSAVGFTYHPGGLLETMTDPEGGVHEFAFDGSGRLTRDEDPTGQAQTIAYATVGDVSTAVVTAPGGQVTTYSYEERPNGTTVRSRDDANGGRSESVTARDGSVRVFLPDGSQQRSVLGPDPRFGMQAPVPVLEETTMPYGQKVTSEETRDVLGSSTSGKLRRRVQVNGRTTEELYDLAARKLSVTTPAGRTSTTTFDAAGRPVQAVEAAGRAPIEFAYDAKGRVTEISQRDRSAAFTYDAKGRLASRTDALGKAVTFEHDGGDRVSAIHLPGGRTYRYGYDRLGNRTSVTTPRDGVHLLTSTERSETKSHSTPLGATTAWDYDANGMLELADPAGEGQLDYGRDAAGRLGSVTAPEAVVEQTSVAGSDRTESLERTPAGAADADVQGLAMSWNGSLPAGTTFSGPAAGSFQYAHDENLLLQSTSFWSGTAGVETPYQHDLDGLATAEGPFTIGRRPADGLQSSVSDGKLAYGLAYDDLGEFASRTLGIEGAEGPPVYAESPVFDAGGRLISRTESILGKAVQWTYAYDAVGQLVDVARDGTNVEHYEYDLAGNRTVTRMGSDAAQTWAFDADDRLTTGRTYDAAGQLATRGTDTFDYALGGELLSATVAGVSVAYGYDGLGRRVSRTEGSARETYLYGNPADATQVTASVGADGTVDHYRYDDSGRLYAIQRGLERFYVASDHVGSPRVVFDAQGTVLRRIDRDAFGRITSDSGGFRLPIGFGGGIADPVTGLVRMGFRDYDPAAGRFTAPDPLLFKGSEANLYAYAANDPVGRHDPSGLASAQPRSGVAVEARLGFGPQLSGRVAVTPDGISVTVGGGVGVGAGVGVDFLGKMAPAGAQFKASAGVDVLGNGASAEITAEPQANAPAKNWQGSAKACMLGMSVDTGGNLGSNYAAGQAKGMKDAVKKGKLKADASAYLELNATMNLQLGPPKSPVFNKSAPLPGKPTRMEM